MPSFSKIEMDIIKEQAQYEPDSLTLAALKYLTSSSKFNESSVSDAGTFILTETSLDLHDWGKNPEPKLKLNGQDRFAKEYRFATLFLQTEQLAKSFIDVYGTQGSIEHMFPEYWLLEDVMETSGTMGWGRYYLSDDLRCELQFQYGNMTCT
jgi:hypothetical protein